MPIWTKLSFNLLIFVVFSKKFNFRGLSNVFMVLRVDFLLRKEFERILYTEVIVDVKPSLWTQNTSKLEFI